MNDTTQELLDRLEADPEYQEWMETHGDLVHLNWEAGRAGDEEGFLISYLLLQEARS